MNWAKFEQLWSSQMNSLGYGKIVPKLHKICSTIFWSEIAVTLEQIWNNFIETLE